MSGEARMRSRCGEPEYPGQPELPGSGLVPRPTPSTLNLQLSTFAQALNPPPSTLNSSEPHHQVLSASHWQPVTSVADVSRRRDCAKSVLGVQISIPGSDRSEEH